VASTQELLWEGGYAARSPRAISAATRELSLLQRDVLRGCPVGRTAQDADALAIPELNEILDRRFSELRAVVVAVVEEGVAAGELPG